MSRTFGKHSVWILVVALVSSAGLAQAATGYSITQAQEKKIALGMSEGEVRETLGRPAAIVRYRNEAGPTWTYQVAGSPFGETEFDLDFGPDGKLRSASERVLGTVWERVSPDPRRPVARALP